MCMPTRSRRGTDQASAVGGAACHVACTHCGTHPRAPLRRGGWCRGAAASEARPALQARTEESRRALVIVGPVASCGGREVRAGRAAQAASVSSMGLSRRLTLVRLRLASRNLALRYGDQSTGVHGHVLRTSALQASSIPRNGHLYPARPANPGRPRSLASLTCAWWQICSRHVATACRSSMRRPSNLPFGQRSTLLIGTATPSTRPLPTTGPAAGPTHGGLPVTRYSFLWSPHRQLVHASQE